VKLGRSLSPLPHGVLRAAGLEHQGSLPATASCAVVPKHKELSKESRARWQGRRSDWALVTVKSTRLLAGIHRDRFASAARATATAYEVSCGLHHGAPSGGYATANAGRPFCSRGEAACIGSQSIDRQPS
jgi:hypothetical protein